VQADAEEPVCFVGEIDRVAVIQVADGHEVDHASAAVRQLG
jgi:hypothetical protein